MDNADRRLLLAGACLAGMAGLAAMTTANHVTGGTAQYSNALPGQVGTIVAGGTLSLANTNPWANFQG